MKDVTKQILKQPLELKRMKETTTRKDIYLEKTKRILKMFPKEPVLTKVLLGKTIVRQVKLSRKNIILLVKSYLELYLLDVGYANTKDAFLIYLKARVPKQEGEEKPKKRNFFF